MNTAKIIVGKTIVGVELLAQAALVLLILWVILAVIPDFLIALGRFITAIGTLLRALLNFLHLGIQTYDYRQGF